MKFDVCSHFQSFFVNIIAIAHCSVCLLFILIHFLWFACFCAMKLPCARVENKNCVIQSPHIIYSSHGTVSWTQATNSKKKLSLRRSIFFCLQFRIRILYFSEERHSKMKKKTESNNNTNFPGERTFFLHSSRFSFFSCCILRLSALSRP